MSVKRVIHPSDPYAASRAADLAGAKAAKKNPARARFFAQREVLSRDGTFPFGEGHLYARPARGKPMRGRGRPGEVAHAGHRGSKREQQDAFGSARFSVGRHGAAALVVADGVSAAGRLAKPASGTATAVFLERLQIELGAVPARSGPRPAQIEAAIERAALAANFEVVRQVLFDARGDGRYDAKDRAALARRFGVALPQGALTPAQMKRLAPLLDEAVGRLDEEGRAALTTFAAAVAVGDDLYTFSSGDAVVGLHRPTEPEGGRFVHLTHRDQEVVDLYRSGADPAAHRDVFENVITDSFGDSARLSGTLRRYPNLLQKGDVVLVASDGLGPRGGGEGLSRAGVERVLKASPSVAAGARALVDAQLRGLSPGEYQDNIGVALLEVT